MPILERLLSILAPHDCLVCGDEGSLLCEGCAATSFTPVPSRCYKCQRLSEAGRTCLRCRRASKLTNVYVVAEYESIAKELVHKLKFERTYAAASRIATFINTVVPADFDGVVVPVPTASSRRRQRGYDQAELISQEFARSRGLKCVTALGRLGQTRQVGTKRAERLKQLHDAFYVTSPDAINGSKVLIIDDVLTTGATVEAVAAELKRAGTKQIHAAVFAQA